MLIAAVVVLWIAAIGASVGLALAMTGARPDLGLAVIPSVPLAVPFFVVAIAVVHVLDTWRERPTLSAAVQWPFWSAVVLGALWLVVWLLSRGRNREQAVDE